MPRFSTALAAATLTIVLTSPLAAQFDAGGSCNTTTGQQCSVVHRVQVQVEDIMRLSLDDGATVLQSPTADDYNRGFTESPGPTASVTANRDYIVTVQASDPHFASNNGYLKPAADLQWRAGSSPRSGDMSFSGDFMVGPATSMAQEQINFRTVYSWENDRPGTYSLTVNFTLSAP